MAEFNDWLLENYGITENDLTDEQWEETFEMWKGLQEDPE